MSARWHSWDVPTTYGTLFKLLSTSLREKLVLQEEKQSASGDSDFSAIVRVVQNQTEVDTDLSTLHRYITHIEQLGWTQLLN
jgi:hypothetical protein